MPALVLALLHASLAAGAQPAHWRTLQLEGGLELRLLEIESNRSTPSAHVQQGIETIEAQGRERVLLARPLGSLGGEPRILYSLLAQADRDPSPLVRISGQVLIGQRAFAWQAQVGSDRWQQSVLEIVEALAQLPAPGGLFELTLAEVDDAGDVARGRPLFSARASQPVLLTAEPVSYALISKDARWIFLEPLVAIRTDTWRRYELSLQYGLAPYVSPQAVSPDGRRIVFSRRDCPADCAGAATEYFVVTLPWIP